MSRTCNVLLTLTLLAIPAVLAAEDRKAPAEPAAITLPGEVSTGIVSGDHFYAVAANGRLIDVDLKAQKVKDLGTFDQKLSPMIDVAGDKAAVVAEGQAGVVDLKTGKLGDMTLKGDPICSVTLLGRQTLCVQTATAITSIDSVWGTTRKLAEFEGKAQPGTPAVKQKVENRLYVMDGQDGTLSIIDLKEGKRVDEIKLPELRVGGIHSVGSMYVIGDRAFVVGLRFSYGVWTESFGVVDLKSKKYTALKLPSGLSRSSTVLGGPENKVLLTGVEGTHQFDAEGKFLGTLAKVPGRVLASWEGQILAVEKDTLRLVKLTRQESETK